MNTGMHMPVDITGWSTLPNPQNFSNFNFMPTALFTCPPLPNIQTEQNTAGDVVTVQTFYEGPPTCKCCKNWVEKEPAEVPEEAKKKYTGAAIIVYKCKDHDSETLGSLKKFKAATVAIQSPIICEEIAPILAKQSFFCGEKEKIIMQKPFKELYFSHSAILNLCDEKEEGSEEKEHLQLLVKVMDDLFGKLSKEVAEMQAKGLISNTLLWTLFPCGIIVYSQTENQQDQAFEVLKFLGNLLSCRYVEYTGTSFGVKTKTISIPEFKGTYPIERLNVYPLSFHMDAAKIEKKLAQRGRKAFDYQNISFGAVSRESTGVGDWDDEDFSDTDCNWNGEKRSPGASPVSLRVVIDSFAYYQKFFMTISANMNHEPLVPCNYRSPEDEKIRKKSQELLKLRRRPSAEVQKANQELIESESMWAMLISPNLPAFFMGEKRWGWVGIDDICPIDWAGDAYDQLLIPPDRKDLVLSFVQTHQKTRNLGTDIVQGKGQGLVVLLSGPTGTGTTLTVEAVSERKERPLYHLQAGELGLNPSSVKSELKKAFEHCEEWDCVLLLDEADTLIRSRRESSTTDEDLCCVLLATLEYYSGVIFLTTNLPDNVDDAIASRIDIYLEYPHLDFDTRLQLWTNFLLNPPKAVQDSERPPVSVSDDDLKRLARWHLNGRDIKHAINNATKWCFIKNSPVTRNALEVGIQVTAPSAVMEDQGEVEQSVDDSDATPTSQPRSRKRKRLSTDE